MGLKLNWAQRDSSSCSRALVGCGEPMSTGGVPVRTGMEVGAVLVELEPVWWVRTLNSFLGV